MTEQWEKYEPSPIEFMHDILLDEFHKFRKQRTDHTTVGIDGLEFNGIVVRAKNATYEKYKALKLDNVILKSDLEEGSKNEPT